jgi:hypothetical protein
VQTNVSAATCSVVPSARIRFVVDVGAAQVAAWPNAIPANTKADPAMAAIFENLTISFSL